MFWIFTSFVGLMFAAVYAPSDWGEKPRLTEDSANSSLLERTTATLQAIAGADASLCGIAQIEIEHLFAEASRNAACCTQISRYFKPLWMKRNKPVERQATSCAVTKTGKPTSEH